jgi:hypothetical protein
VEVLRWAVRFPDVIDRRSVLRRGAGAIGTAAIAGAAGCLFGGDGGGSDDSSDSFLATLHDPRPAVAPSFHAAYSYDPARLRDELGADPMPELAGRFVAVIGNLEGTGVADVDRLSGQTVRQYGHPGADVAVTIPNGTDLVAQGSIDVQGAVDWLGAQDGLNDLGDARGYRRFGNGGPVIEAFAVDDAAFTFGNRERTNLDASELANATIEAIERGGVPEEYPSPQLRAAVGALPVGAATVATQFDLVPERPDTGTDAFDAAAASLVAAGVGASIADGTVAITRILRYRRDRRAAAADVQAAVEAAVEAGHFADADWTVSASDRSVRIEGQLSTGAVGNTPIALRRAVPVPGYDDLALPVDPRELGRDAPPRAAWSASQLDDGRIAIVHARGPSVEDLTVAYTADGERVTEDWAAPVEQDDRFETSSAPDGGTVLDLVWAAGTANETILLRIEIPDN